MPIEAMPMMKQDDNNIGVISRVKENLLKVPIAKEGTWFHPQYGSVKFSLDDLENIKENFEKNILSHTPYITFGHVDEEPFSIDSHRKRGDLKELFIDDSTLFGIFKAKPEAYESVEKGHYEFSSCEVIRGFRNKDSGEEVGSVLLRVALTNSPYLPFSTEEKVMALSENISYKDRTILSINMKTEVDKESFKEEVKDSQNESSTNTSENIDINKQDSSTDTKDSTGNLDKTTSDKEVEDQTEKSQTKDSKEESKEEKEEKQEDSNTKPDLENKETQSSPTPGSKEVKESEKKDDKDDEVESVKEGEEGKEKEETEEVKATNQEIESDQDASKKEEQPNPISDNEVMNQTNTPEVVTVEKNSQNAEKPKGKPVVPDPVKLSNLYKDNSGNINIEGIVQSMEAKLQKVYQQKLSTQESTIGALSRQLEEIKQEKLSQEKVLQEQKLSALQAQEKIAKEQDRILSDYLIGSGVTPALVQRFTLLRESFLKGEYTLSLSQGKGEPPQEVTVTQALADLIVDAVNTNTVEFSQQGVSYRRNDPQGVFTSIEETIRKNREMAQSRINNVRV